MVLLIGNRITKGLPGMRGMKGMVGPFGYDGHHGMKGGKLIVIHGFSLICFTWVGYCILL